MWYFLINLLSSLLISEHCLIVTFDKAFPFSSQLDKQAKHKGKNENWILYLHTSLNYSYNRTSFVFCMCWPSLLRVKSPFFLSLFFIFQTY